jgi:histidine decarboxylase
MQPETETDSDGLIEQLDAARPLNIGFPGATDFDYRELAEVLTRQLLNNVGDPWVDGLGVNQTKAAERQVVDFLADLFRAPARDRWGYVTTGGTEGNIFGLQVARSIHPDAVVYHSDAAHPSVDKAIGLLGMPSVRICTDEWGQLEYRDLAAQLEANRRYPAVVVATVGTTLTEAVDDVRVISAMLDRLSIRRRFIHADAALSGIPLGLLDAASRPGFDFADGADSITVSGHKFLGSPMPCGVVVVRASLRTRSVQPGRYTGSPDGTITGSRSGHAPLLLQHRLRELGSIGLRERAVRSRVFAQYAYERLVAMGWTAHRFPHAFTVVLQTPPEQITKKWVLAEADGWSHLITMPGVTAATIDAFLADMAQVCGTGAAMNGKAHLPEPRVPSELEVAR